MPSDSLLPVLLAGTVMFMGCASRKPDGGAEASAVIVTPASANIGKIASVNPTARFVVITYPVGVSLPGTDQRLNIYRAGLKVAEVTVTGPARDLNTVADITAGECQPGDEAREN
jgi:hypothetical protein